MESFPVVDPDVLFRLLPGSPLRPKGVELDPGYFDRLGYQVADDIRVTGTITTMRAGDPDTPYDVDLMYRLLVIDTIRRAEQVFDAELHQTLRLGKHVAIQLEWQPRADAARCWRSPSDGMNNLFVAQMRYRNYVMRYVGQINRGGYFTSEGSFFNMIHALDAQIPEVLESAA